MAARPTLLVLVKYPTPGAVKTRLAASIGLERAAALYREWIGRVLDQLQPFRKTPVWWATSTGPPRGLRALEGPGRRLVASAAR